MPRRTGRTARGAAEVEDEADPETRARRAWAFPPVTGRVRGLDVADLAPADPDHRSFLIEAEHPEFRRALQRGDDEIEIDGTTVNPRLHIAMHEVVAAQLWAGDPPETWEAAQRLTRIGHERHEVLHLLAEAVTGIVRQALRDPTGRDLNRERRAVLRALGTRTPGTPKRQRN